MGELPSFTSDGESSANPDKDKDKDSKSKPAVRAVPALPLVPRSLELRRDMPRPRAPLEQLLGRPDPEADNPDKKEKSTEDESEETAEEQTPAADTQEQAIETGQLDVEAPAEAIETAVDTEELPQPIEEAPEQPYEGLLHVQRNEAGDDEFMPLQAEDQEEQPQPPATNASITPPPPPPVPPVPAGMPNQGSTPNWNIAPTPAPQETGVNTDIIPQPQVSMEQHQEELHDAEYYAEKRGLRRGLVAGFITGYVIKAYLAKRKRERYEKAAEIQIEKRDEQISRLQREQWQLTEQMNARAEEERHRHEQQLNQQNRPPTPEQPAKPPAEVVAAAAAGQEEIFDQEGNRIILQPGWRVERSAGGYSVVLDEHNRVVHDAIRYGEAYQRDQRREQINDDLFSAFGGSGPAGGPLGDGGLLLPPSAQQQSYQQLGDLPGQHPSADIQHRLPKPRSQVSATLTSPWLWTAVALLFIVYFIAQLA